MALTPWPASREFVEAIQNPGICFSDPELKNSTPALDRLGMPVVSSGQFAYVFKVKSLSDGSAQAVRCFRAHLGDREQRYKAINRYLNKVSNPYFASFEYDAQGILVAGKRYPILTMEWIEGLPLDSYVSKILSRPDVIEYLAAQWVKVVASLQNASIAHGDLQHGNIIIANGMIRLVDLDGMFVPDMKGWTASELGHVHYQHPRRKPGDFGSTLDNFSALVIYLSLLVLARRPRLWDQYHDENLIFTKTDFLDPSRSKLLKEAIAIGELPRRIAEAVVKACDSGPLNCPPLADLVDPPVSKLPAWMTQQPDVLIHHHTREAGVSAPPAPAVPPPAGRDPVNSPASPPATTTVNASAGATIFGGAAATPILTFISPATRREVLQNSAKSAVKFASVGVIVWWIWFPSLRFVYTSFGVTEASAVLLTVTTYLAICSYAGYRAAQNSRLVRWTISPAPPPVFHHPTILSPSQPHAPAAAAPAAYGGFVGNRISRVFHRPDCEWVLKISGRNSAILNTGFEAQQGGYRPCRVCRP